MTLILFPLTCFLTVAMFALTYITFKFVRNVENDECISWIFLISVITLNTVFWIWVQGISNPTNTENTEVIEPTVTTKKVIVKPKAIVKPKPKAIVKSKSKEIALNKFVECLIQAETNGIANPPNGDKGKAVGPLQIWKITVDDVNRICKVIKNNRHFKYSDRKSKYKSKLMCKIYLKFYGKHFKKVTGKRVSTYYLATMWNGGGCWYNADEIKQSKRDNLARYWNTRVKPSMKKLKVNGIFVHEIK